MKNKMFEMYFLRYKNLIIRIVVDKTRDYQAAQEICQQVFVAFYTNMEKIDSDLVKAWLIRCTQNALIDYLRKTRVKKQIFSELPLSEVGNLVREEYIEVCEDRVVSKQLAGKILKDVRSVNEHWYEVLILHCVEGLTYAEAAEKLNISESVLRARLCRARAYIRKQFGEEYQEL